VLYFCFAGFASHFKIDAASEAQDEVADESLQTAFDTNYITPGTAFMQRVRHALQHLACKLVLEAPTLQVYLSGKNLGGLFYRLRICLFVFLLLLLLLVPYATLFLL
jgi:hypothetical protein